MRKWIKLPAKCSFMQPPFCEATARVLASSRQHSVNQRFVSVHPIALHHVLYGPTGSTRSLIWCRAVGHICVCRLVGYDMYADVRDLASITSKEALTRNF